MDLKCIITSSSIRQFPTDPLPAKALTSLDAARGERLSFQLAYRSEKSDTYDVFRVRASIEGPKGWSLRVRREGLVPVPNMNIPFEHDPIDNDCWGKVPGMVPDPLFDSDEEVLRPCQKQAFWFSFRTPEKTAPGAYVLTVRLQMFDRKGEKPVGRPLVRKLTVRVHDVVLKPHRGFCVTHWIYCDCIAAWYRTNGFDERFWKLLEAYLRNMAEHGQDAVYVPVFTPSLDKDKIPSQLLKVKRLGKGRYRFDWSDVKRYVELARKCGIKEMEWCHLASQGGAKHAIRIYEGQGEGEKLLWPDGTPSTAPVYAEFLRAYLPELKKFLDENGLFKTSFFHISDEPHGEEALANYRAVRAIILEAAPWFTATDALSELAFAREKLVELPDVILMKALDFIREGIPCSCYYCGGPRAKYLNHLIDTALPKVAMHGFVFYRWPFKGFLHWGYNYWNVFGTRTLLDPFSSLNGRDGGGAVPDAAHGDMFVVYPGENGPIDSIRWEVFAEAMQDYDLMQTLGIPRDADFMREVKSFEDFPKTVEWRRRIRARLFRIADTKR